MNCVTRVPTFNLHLPPHQPLPIIKTILITLQRPDLARRPPHGIHLLGPQHAPVARDAQHAGPDAALGLERDGLARVQPVPVVPGLEVGREPFAEELLVHGLEARQDPRQERLEAERRGRRRQEVRDGDCGARVDGVEADAEDDLVGAVGVDALREDAADLAVDGLVLG